MHPFKSLLTKTLIRLFTAFFVYPAILFACLVLGFTSSWKSGTVMLVSALLLLLVLKREAAAIRPAGVWRTTRKRKPRRGTPAGKRPLGYFPDAFDSAACPPQLSEIYSDMAAQLREQETLLALLRTMDGKPGGKHPEGCQCSSCEQAFQGPNK
ncbi:hypothetical protein [Paenibacillus glycinis]|uniref:Uncharacterized protein n=1 Tax=Paenibacillus glycinis TaxID=2697035 RepID=A0ABW9XMQ3_9BACL|nr:hypothetical protein [Paenibacillus glycinis]NBD23914.1 hypothetical protein [Paenibacillus glycinis]